MTERLLDVHNTERPGPFWFQYDHRRLVSDLDRVFHPTKERDHSGDGDPGLSCSQAGLWPSVHHHPGLRASKTSFSILHSYTLATEEGVDVVSSNCS